MRIHQQDQKRLSWYFTRAACSFEGSTFGNLLKRQSDLAVDDGERCTSCAATGFTEDSNPCPRCYGFGFVRGKPQGYKPQGLHFSTSCCFVCKGSGTTNDGSSCAGCAGTGYFEHHAASYTSEEHSEGTTEVDEDLLFELARISRQLKALRSVSYSASVVMEQYWGERGEVWADEPNGMRTWAIFALTKPGVALIQKFAGGEVDPDRTLRQIRELKLNESENVLMNAGLSQSERLVAYTAESWKTANPRLRLAS